MVRAILRVRLVKMSPVHYFPYYFSVGAGEPSPPDHVVKRAQGGSDFDLDRLVALCPRCHAQTDAPCARGRLVVTPLGAGRFTAEATRGAGKWAIRA
jgi:hypothetical protein